MWMFIETSSKFKLFLIFLYPSSFALSPRNHLPPLRPWRHLWTTPRVLSNLEELWSDSFWCRRSVWSRALVSRSCRTLVSISFLQKNWGLNKKFCKSRDLVKCLFYHRQFIKSPLKKDSKDQIFFYLEDSSYHTLSIFTAVDFYVELKTAVRYKADTKGLISF